MLAHFFEDEAVATTQISLIRLHTEKTKPPRALWVSFELGRPLGVPNDPAFQRRVLLSALRLLEAPTGPVLEDYPEDAPAAQEDTTVLACPVSFARDEVDLTETEQLFAAFRREFASIRPWYDVAVKKRGRTTVGASGVTVDAIPGFLCAIVEGSIPGNPRADIALPYTVSLVAADLRSYYGEAITAQPGQESISSRALLEWFWWETAAGTVLKAIRDASSTSEDPLMQLVAGLLIVPAKAARR